MKNMKTTKELAELFNVSTQTIWRWRVQGLPHMKINSQNIRYDLEEVMSWLKGKK